MNEEQLSNYFLSITRQLTELSVTSKSIQKELERMNGNVSALWRSENGQNERLARLETKAGIFGAVGGALVAASIAGIKWIAGR